MDGLARSGRRLRHCAQRLLARVLHAEVSQRRGQTDAHAEVEHFLDLIHVGVLQHELDERAERNFLTVIHLVRLGRNGEAVVDGVRAGQTAGFKADAGQIGVCLDDVLNSGRADVLLHRKAGLQAVGQQRVVARAGQNERRVRHLSARTGRRVGVGGSLRLKVRGQRIAHAGDQQTGRSLADDVRIHQHDIGVCGQPQVFLEHALVRVDDGQRGARRVRSRDGRHDHDRLLGIVCQSLRGVVNFAAADANAHVAAEFVKARFQAVDLRLAALAVEILKMNAAPGGFKALFDHLTHAAVTGFADEHERLCAERLRVFADVVQFALTLDVAARRNDDICHRISLRCMVSVQMCTLIHYST